MAAIGKDLCGAFAVKPRQCLIQPVRPIKADRPGHHDARAHPAGLGIGRLVQRIRKEAQLPDQAFHPFGPCVRGEDVAGAPHPVPDAIRSRFGPPCEAVERAESVDPGVDKCPGPVCPRGALRDEVRQPVEAVQAVGEVPRWQGHRPGCLGALQCQALHADPPDVAHQGFAAPCVGRNDIRQIDGETTGHCSRQFQPLARADSGILAGDAAKPAPKGCVVGAGTRAVSSEFAVSTTQGTPHTETYYT